MSHPSRRAALAQLGAGFGTLGLAALLADDARAAAPAGLPHHPPRAKRVIFVFLAGGPSHIDLLDPKPEVIKRNGQPLPFAQPRLVRTRTGNLLASPWKFERAGQCGTEVSELLPHLKGVIDDVCVVRSMKADNINHNGACLQMNTGDQTFSRPSLGSWLTYGLGTANRDLPGFVVLSPSQPAQGAPLWSSSFLPAAHQGTLVSDLARPIANLGRPDLTSAEQRLQLDTLRKLNQAHRDARQDRDPLDARIESFELAFRMQREAPAAFDLSRESPRTRALYGIGESETDIFGKQCLLARRLVERGVRMVQVYHTQTAKRSSCQLWDQHGDLRTEHPANCRATDKPVAGLIRDLKARGLLEDTLVVWGGEFGRTPTAENANGREHHPFGFSMWLAGGGIKGGLVHGATDPFGWHAEEDIVHVHDLHATILHLMGIDHERLTYRHGGRDYRLTDVHGEVVEGILA